MRGCACRGTAGFAHVSCLAEQAKILVAEALENNLDTKVKNQRFKRWHMCSLCEQGVPRYRASMRARVGMLEDVPRGAWGGRRRTRFEPGDGTLGKWFILCLITKRTRCP